MPRHRWDPVAPHVRVVHPVRVGGDLTPDRARGPRWTQTSSGFYVPSDVDRSRAQQRIVEVAARLPAGAAVTGWASCLLHGAAWLDGLARDGRTPLPVPVAVGPRGGVRRSDDVSVTFERLPEWEVWQRYRVRVTRPERAVFYRVAPPRRARGPGRPRERARGSDHFPPAVRGLRTCPPLGAQVRRCGMGPDPCAAGCSLPR